MSALPKKQWTVEEYLAFERASQEKHEYLEGEVYLMTGASRNHNLIVVNVVTSLNSQLRERPCEVYAGDMRVKARPKDYFYPDVTVVCDQPDFEDAAADTLLNPTVIFEVLSPSTETYDRGKKFQCYRTLASLWEYILIAPDAVRVEHYRRQEDDAWQLVDVTTLDVTFALPSIDCSLVLQDIYAKVTFDEG
jgi:Uma2 family endonuclease